MSRTLDNSDDDLDLPQRSRRPDSREEMARDMSYESDREFTLSTGTVLALFFGLALLCAVFFGFGYSIGHKSAKTAAEAVTVPVPEPATPDENATAKPAAGAPAVTATIPGYQADPTVATSKPSAATPKITTSFDGTRVTITAAGTPPAAKPARTESASTPPAAAPVPATTSTVTPPTASSTDPNAVYVQIAAVSHQEDANVLLNALKRRGYSVFTRSSSTDKLIHVQVGPYSGKKDAEAMRQRLLGDGYNAILK